VSWEHVRVPDAALLRRARLAGLTGSVLLAAGAFWAGVLPRLRPWAGIPDLDAAGGVAGAWGVAAAAVGMGLLVVAWWWLHRVPVLEVRWVQVTAALWAVPLALAPPLFSRDVYSYAAQGDLLAHGVDPYRSGPAALPSQWLSAVSPAWYDTPVPYGPLFMLVAGDAAELAGGSLLVALLLLRLAAVAGVVLTAVFLPRLAAACGVDPGRALWLGIASPLLLTHLVSGAHNDALMVGLLVAGLAHAAERRPLIAAALLGLAVGVKVPAAVALPFAVLLHAGGAPPTSGEGAAADRVLPPRLVRAGLVTGGVAAAAFAVPTLLAGLGLGWLAALGTPGTSVQWTSLPTGWGMAAAWLGSPLGLERPGAVAVARSLGLVLTAVVVGALWWRVRHQGERTARVVAACGAALLAVVLLAPVFHPWYALWALVPLAASSVAERARTWLLLGSSALCFLVLPDGYNLARDTVLPGVLLNLAVTAFLATLLVRWLHRRWAPERRSTPIGG